MSAFWFLLTALCAVVVTVGVALGGHIYGWEVIVWAWTATVWCGFALMERARR